MQRPEPGQQARRRQPRFAPVGQQKPQTAPGFLGDHGDLDGIAFHIFHNAARRGIAHTTRHKRSFSPNILMAARRRESGIFAVLASPGPLPGSFRSPSVVLFCPAGTGALRLPAFGPPGAAVGREVFALNGEEIRAYIGEYGAQQEVHTGWLTMKFEF